MSSKQKMKYPFIGGFLLLNFLIVVLVKFQLGRTQELLWLSHVALVMAGIGFMFGRNLFVYTAATSIFLPHLIWLSDFTCWLLWGSNPLGITTYLNNANIWIWFGTLHHFYLLPVLTVLILRNGRYPLIALPVAIATYLYLTLFSRMFSHSAFNINYAFNFLPGLDAPLLNWFNQLPVHIYIIALNLTVDSFAFLPAAVLFYIICIKREGIIKFECLKTKTETTKKVELL